MQSIFFHFVSRDTCELCDTLLKFRYTVSVLLSLSPMKQTIEASLVLLIQSELTQASSEHSFPRIQETSTYLQTVLLGLVSQAFLCVLSRAYHSLLMQIKILFDSL